MGPMIQSPTHPNGLLRVPVSFSPVRLQGGLAMLPTFQTQTGSVEHCVGAVTWQVSLDIHH